MVHQPTEATMATQAFSADVHGEKTYFVPDRKLHWNGHPVAMWDVRRDVEGSYNLTHTLTSVMVSQRATRAEIIAEFKSDYY